MGTYSQSQSSRFVDLVVDGLNLALRAGKTADSSLVARKIGFDALGLFASPAYLRRRGRPKTVPDLAHHECVLFRGSHGKTEWRLTGPRGEERVTVHGPLNADEMALVQQAVSAGVGIGLLPTIGVRLAAARGVLPLPVHLLPEYSVGGNGLHVVSPSTRVQSASVSAFRDFLITELTALWSSA